ncbi:MAG: zinc ribbon domain-containing protein [Anaerolineae bacterium]
MPIYEYICRECGEKFDKFVRSSSAKIQLKCPNCGSDQAQKAFSAFSTTANAAASFGGATRSAPACGPIG